MDKLLMSPKEAAEMLSICRSKLYELLADGKLSSVRIDGCRRIAVDVLRATPTGTSSRPTSSTP